MSMIKYVSPAGWDWDRPVAIPVKYGSRGLLGADRAEFIKTASHVFLDVLDNLKVAKDEVPVHVIALGALEAYGPNRNGDGFPEKACRDYHGTFTKFGRWFRNHRNKPERGHPHFGLLKASAYNDRMRRVELLAVLNAEKSACQRNGGFVADQELEKLARDEDIPVSMACRVPFDECSWCHHQAAKRDDYCTAEKCAAGGCATNLTRMLKLGGDIHHLHVINRQPVWFDMSKVFRPADRICYGAKADWLAKAAADGGVFDLADAAHMAEGDTPPLSVLLYQDGLPGQYQQRVAAQIKLAYALSALEEKQAASQAIDRAFDPRLQPPFPVELLDKPGTEKAASALAALAGRRIVLPLRDFARWVGQAEHVKAAAACLPGAYARMLADESLERRVYQNPYRLSEKVASAKVRAAALSYAEEFSLERQHVRDRTARSSLRGYSAPESKTSFAKEASDHVAAEQLARDYALYKLAALEWIAGEDPEFALTAQVALRQNHVE